MTGSATTVDRDHPITAALSVCADELKGLRDQPAWSLTPAQTRDALVEVTRLQARVAELEARLADHGRTVEVEADSGASSTADWWAHATKQTRPTTKRKVRLGKALATDLHAPVRTALADGRVVVEQAEVIIAAIDALPEDLDPVVVRDAQQHLLERAGEFDAKHLRILGRRILEVVAPEIGEAHEAALLEKEERDAAARARLWGRRDGHGRVRGGFELPEGHWDMLLKAVQAFCAPKHRTAVDGRALDAQLPSDHRMGLGFMELIESLDPAHLPDAGGVSATVVVTMTKETLLGGLKAAQLDTGTRISAGLARRLACQAGVIPAVLGGKSEVLDLGRRRRFHTKAQRIAMAINQNFQCATEGCDRPTSMAHAHHVQTWASGGPTTVDDGLLLCWHHHNRAHDTTYDMRRLPDGQVRFHRLT